MIEPNAAAGWYPDAYNEGQEQYWDGEKWTEARRPVGAPPSPAAPPPPDRGSGVLLVVSYLAAFLLPIVGFILGLVLLVRKQTGHGVAVVLISIAIGLAACAIILDSADEELSAYGECIDDARTAREIEAC